jgi:hyperosmotically inducible protein
MLACRTNQAPEDQVSDARITAEVKARLASELQAATLTNVEVNTTNGVVTLAGQVRDAESRQKAEQIARSVEGVREVNNNLQAAGAAPAQ